MRSVISTSKSSVIGSVGDTGLPSHGMPVVQNDPVGIPSPRSAVEAPNPLAVVLA